MTKLLDAFEILLVGSWPLGLPINMLRRIQLWRIWKQEEQFDAILHVPEPAFESPG